MSMWANLRRARYLFGRERFDAGLDAELRLHLENRADELRREGMTEDDARAQARREFGNGLRTAEESRGAWQFPWFEQFFGDLRYAGRRFARKSAFAAAAIACLGLGIGANTLIFSLVNAVLLRALPYPDADRIAMVRFTPPQQPTQRLGTNSRGYFFLRQHSSSFEKMGARFFWQ